MCGLLPHNHNSKNRIMKKLFFATVALATATFVAQAQIHPRIEVAGNFAKRSVTDSKEIPSLDIRCVQVFVQVLLPKLV